MIYLEIDSQEALTSFLAEVKKTGLLKDVSMKEIETSVKGKGFPIRVPVNLNGVLAICGNPMVRRIFGSKIDSKFKGYLEAIKTGQ